MYNMCIFVEKLNKSNIFIKEFRGLSHFLRINGQRNT